MSKEGNKAIIQKYVEEVLNKGELMVADQLYSPDYKRFITPDAMPLTPDAQKARLKGLRMAFPDLHCAIEEMIAEDDLVVFRATISGTHQSQFQGIAPTGKRVKVSAIDIVRFQNGKLVEHWGGPDMWDILQQLGAIVSTKQ